MCMTPSCMWYGETRLSYPTLRWGHLSGGQFSSVYQHINRKSLSIQSAQLLEIDPTCILVHVQKDSCARLIIVWTAADGKQPKCPLAQTAWGHQTDERSTSEFTRAGSATPRGGGGISRCSAFTGPQSQDAARQPYPEDTPGTRFNIWQGVNLFPCTSSVLCLF